MITLFMTYIVASVSANTAMIAAPTAQICISGDAQNTALISQLEHAKKTSILSQMLAKKYNLNQPKYSYCQECSTQRSALSRQNNRTAQIIQTASQQRIFNDSCLIESAKFEHSSPEIVCPKKSSKDKPEANLNLCMTEKHLAYQNAVISDFYKCVKKVSQFPITPAALFEIYNLESGFKPHLVNRGGAGMAQLTSIFIRDIHQPNRGRPLLENIIASKDSECEIAKRIVNKDLGTAPNLLNDICSFTQYGEGFERNILYSMLGLATIWEKDISTALGDYFSRYPNHPKLAEVSKLALQNAYGASGRVAGRAAIRRLSKFPPEEFIKKIKRPLEGLDGKSLTRYNQRIELKKGQLTEKLKEPIKTKFKKSGADACVLIK